MPAPKSVRKYLKHRQKTAYVFYLIGKFLELLMAIKIRCTRQNCKQFFARQIFTLLRDLKLEVQNINSREKVSRSRNLFCIFLPKNVHTIKKLGGNVWKK